MMMPSVKTLIKWSAIYLFCVLAGLVNLHAVTAKEISEISVDFIENGKEKEAIIDLKEFDKKGKKSKKHKKNKKKEKEIVEIFED